MQCLGQMGSSFWSKKGTTCSCFIAVKKSAQNDSMLSALDRIRSRNEALKTEAAQKPGEEDMQYAHRMYYKFGYDNGQNHVVKIPGVATFKVDRYAHRGVAQLHLKITDHRRDSGRGARVVGSAVFAGPQFGIGAAAIAAA
jgi:hypothetical protein